MLQAQSGLMISFFTVVFSESQVSFLMCWSGSEVCCQLAKLMFC